MGRWGRRRRQLLYDLEETRWYCNLKEEALARTVWAARFGRGYCPVVRQNMWWWWWWWWPATTYHGITHARQEIIWHGELRFATGDQPNAIRSPPLPSHVTDSSCRWPLKESQLSASCSWSGLAARHMFVLYEEVCCPEQRINMLIAFVFSLICFSLPTASLFLDIVSFHLSSVSNSLSTPPKPLSPYSVAASA